MRDVTVEIMGLSLRIASDADEEWIQNVARIVEERMRAIEKQSKAVNSITVAIAAALDFADELERLRREHSDLCARIEELNRRMAETNESY